MACARSKVTSAPKARANAAAESSICSASGVGTTTPDVVQDTPAPPQEVESSEPPVADSAGAGGVTADPTDEPTDEPSEQATEEPVVSEPTDATEVSGGTEQDASGEAAPQTTFTGGGGELAFTGAPVATYALLSAGLLGSGALLVLLGRRRARA